jgi:transcriptional regulator with XRE-family HTH domain
MGISKMAELGAAVRTERHRRGLSQAALAAGVGVSREWLVRLEAGAPRLEAEKVLGVLNALEIAVLPQEELPTQSDIAKAQKIAWTMSLEAQPMTDEGFQKVLRKVIAHRVARSAA